MLLIQNAHLIDPASRTDGIRDILIEGEKIIKIAEHIAPEEAAVPALTLLNAEGLTAIPGLEAAVCEDLKLIQEKGAYEMMKRTLA